MAFWERLVVICSDGGILDLWDGDQDTSHGPSNTSHSLKYEWRGHKFEISIRPKRPAQDTFLKTSALKSIDFPSSNEASVVPPLYSRA